MRSLQNKTNTSEVVICALYNPHRQCISLLRWRFPTTPEKRSKKHAGHKLWWPKIPRDKLEEKQQFKRRRELNPRNVWGSSVQTRHRFPDLLWEHSRCSILPKLFFSERDISFPILYDCTNHEAVHTTLECFVSESKPTLQNFRSFGNMGYDVINNYFAVNPFQPICHTNTNKICKELYPYLDQMIEVYVPRRTWHR